MADPVALANKCLKLAAPTSGATPAERANAIETALDLIHSNGLVVALPPPRVRKRREPTPPPEPQWPPPIYSPPPFYGGNDWRAATIPYDCTCARCKRILYKGENGWHCTDHGYVHYDITCDDRF